MYIVCILTLDAASPTVTPFFPHNTKSTQTQILAQSISTVSACRLSQRAVRAVARTIPVRGRYCQLSTIVCTMHIPLEVTNVLDRSSKQLKSGNLSFWLVNRMIRTFVTPNGLHPCTTALSSNAMLLVLLWRFIQKCNDRWRMLLQFISHLFFLEIILNVK